MYEVQMLAILKFEKSRIVFVTHNQLQFVQRKHELCSLIQIYLILCSFKSTSS